MLMRGIGGSFLVLLRTERKRWVLRVGIRRDAKSYRLRKVCRVYSGR